MAALPISLSDNQKSQFITGRSCEAEMAMVMAVKHSVVIATVSATQRLPQMTRMIHSISSFSLTHNHNTLLSTNEWHYYTNGYGCWRYISIGTDFVGFEELEALSPSPQIFWCRVHRVTFRESSVIPGNAGSHHPRSTGASWWPPPVLQGESC